MAEEAVTLIQHVVFLILWCLDLTPASVTNPLIPLVLVAEAVIEKLMLDCHLEFANGVLHALHADRAPTLTWFKSLPTLDSLTDGIKRLWGVYLLVLEKPGARFKIYIGSGTNWKTGVYTRLWSYGGESSLPLYVERAIRDGWEITHKGLLCWCPIPSIVLKLPIRILLLAIEAVFTWSLWAMKSRKWFDMHIFCPWRIEDLEYDGLCSHSALCEIVVGEDEFGLSPEALEELAEVRKEKSRIARKAAVQKYIASDKYKDRYTKYKDRKRALDKARRSTVEYKERDRLQQLAKYSIKREAALPKKEEYLKTMQALIEAHKAGTLDTTQESPLAILAKQSDNPSEAANAQDDPVTVEAAEALSNTVKGSQRLHCDACNVSFDQKKDQIRHEATAKHLSKIAGIPFQSLQPGAHALHSKNVVTKRFYCGVCKHAFVNRHKLANHLRTKLHAKKASQSGTGSAGS